MDEVFLSYRNTPERRALVKRLATLLRAHGVSVWWDYGLEAGQSYRTQISQKLAEAKIVAPLWCSESIRSKWVQLESELGKDKLVPARLQRVAPPGAFEPIHAADLIGWDGWVYHPLALDFVRNICRKLGKSDEAPGDMLDDLKHLPRVPPLPEEEADPGPVVPGEAGSKLNVWEDLRLTWRNFQAKENRPAVERFLRRVRSVATGSGLEFEVELHLETLPGAEGPLREIRRPEAPKPAPPRRPHVLEGHTELVQALAITPDGTILASGSEDNSIKLWDLATGRELRTLTGHGRRVRALAITPDGKTLASGGGDAAIKLWDLGSGQEKRSLTGHQDWVRALAITPDGKTLISGSGDQKIKLWDIATGRALQSLTGHTDWVRALAITPDGKVLASGSEEQTIKLWDIARGRPLRTLTGHRGEVCALAITPDGKTLISGSGDETIKFWDLARGRERRSLTGSTNWVKVLAVTPDGQTLASGSGDKTIRLWDLATGRETRVLTGHSDWVRALAVTPDGKTLVSGGADKTIRLWDL